jgi:serine/threonine protein kinase
MVAVKRIGLEGLKEEEIAQLMREVDLVKRLTHPSIVKYEGMARDENTLSIILEYVFPAPRLFISAERWLRNWLYLQR